MAERRMFAKAIVLSDWLEQEPFEDRISRQAAIDALTKTSGIRGDALKALYDLPPVTPKQKTGHWIADVDRWGDIVTTVNGYRCSECNNFNTDKDNYCPNCGTKMFEPQESEVEE